MECHKCHKRGIKLWKRFRSLDGHLVCFKCSGDLRPINKDGQVPRHDFPHLMTNDLDDWWVPAVPLNNSYYVLSSVPEEAMDAWKRLPNV